MGQLRFVLIFIASMSGFSLTHCAGAEPSPNRLPSLAETKQWDLLAREIEDGVDVNQAQPDGMTALHWAVHYQNVAAARQLIAAGANVAAENNYGIPPLALACSTGSPSLTELLLSEGADANTTVSGNESMLMNAARSGNLYCVNALIRHGAQLNAKNRNEQTALMWAAAEGHAEIMDALVSAGADLEMKTRSGFTAWFFAAREGKANVISRLLGHGVDIHDTINPVNSNGRAPRKGMSALLFAVESGHFELALQLVDAGADPNDIRSGFGPLHALTWVRRPGRGDNIQGDPGPRVSGRVSSLEFVREMHRRGADVNLQLKRGNHQKARLTKKGATPMLLASFTNDLPLMRVLKELGADPTIPNADGCTPMLAAAGVGVFVADEFPGTEFETIEAIEQLHDWGCDIAMVDENGETVVHGAAYRSFPKVVDRLVELGADPKSWYVENKMGSTPRQVAQGKRPGSFKPNKATISAIDRALKAAGIKPIPWTRPLDRKSWD